MLSHGVFRTDIGQQRERNEDAVLVDDGLGLYAVSDGMGGHAAGEVASRMALAELAAVVTAAREVLERVRSGDEASEHDLVQVLVRGVESAGRALWAAATSRPELAGMGCTLTALLVGRGQVAMAHVGDSRLYLLREGTVEQLSSDHTVAQDLRRAGALTREQAARSPFAHILSRSLGTQEATQVDHLLLDAFPGDRFLLCSDGFTRYLPQPEWLLPRVRGDLDGGAAELLVHANEAGGEDNISVVLVEVTAGDQDDRMLCSRKQDLDEQLSRLRSVAFLRDLSLARLSRVRAACHLRTFQPGDVVLEQGAEADSLWVVVRGSLIPSRDGQDLGVLGPGDHFGATTLLAPRPAGATVRAEAESCVLELPYDELRRLMRLRPWMGLHILEQLGRYLSMPRPDAAAPGAGHGAGTLDSI